MTLVPFGLDGRVALVTGAAGGLGKGICEALAGQGAAIACVDRSREACELRASELVDGGAHAIPVVADVSSSADVAVAVAAVLAELGRIDILVNNAGIYPSRPWHETTEAEWDEVQRVNVKAQFLLARACHAELVRGGHGRIINVSSITIAGAWDNLLAYVTSKGGVMALTRQLARELGPDGITVNCIAPGAFPTSAEAIHPDRAAYTRRILESQALKRRGDAAEVGYLAAFLASDAAAFITGQMINIDGGWIMH